MNDAIIYYRSRPSEPEASETAMRLQREAVRAAVEAGQLHVVGEFIEQEDEANGSRICGRTVPLYQSSSSHPS